jgi:hypothetical protein
MVENLSMKPPARLGISRVDPKEVQVGCGKGKCEKNVKVASGFLMHDSQRKTMKQERPFHIFLWIQSRENEVYPIVQIIFRGK